MKVESFAIHVLACLAWAMATPANEPIPGIGVALRTHGEEIKIWKVIPGGPAANVGLTEGLIIDRIDGVPASSLCLAQCVALLRVAPGSSVRLHLINPETRETMSLRISVPRKR